MCGSRSLRLGAGVDPAGMDTSAQAFRCFGVDGAKAHETPERRLNVAAGAAKAVVKVEMAEGGVKIVAPHQDHHAAAEPDAFRVSGRAIEGLRRLDELVGLALVISGRIGRGGRGCRAGFGLILGTQIAALGDSAPDTEQQCETGCGETTQARILEPKHPLTHKIPELLPAGTFLHGR